MFLWVSDDTVSAVVAPGPGIGEWRGAWDEDSVHGVVLDRECGTLDQVSRKRQLFVAITCFVGGCVFAVLGAAGQEQGIAWLDQGAAYPTGALWGTAVVFLLRAGLAGRSRRWMFANRHDRDADTYGRHHGPAEPPKS
ncbi:hypothetical protein [Amycolatopsis circi]|uniref:hypothetical protein n=1 Tax=Amycolatopsis circi TaxID=871959 RepID=UPI000E26528F|nr:hypothetical protein [Amycolatopsis circi]